MRRLSSFAVAVLVLASLWATDVVVASAAPASSSPATGSHVATVWLCRPGMADDPCTPGLTTTRTTPSGRVLGESSPKATAPRASTASTSTRR